MDAPLIASLNILLAEDNGVMRQLLTKVLLAAGAEKLRVAVDGEDALQQLAQEPASLVILDHAMPGVSGLDIVRHLRANPASGAARPIIIMLSGHSDNRHAAAAREAGVDRLMVKPVSPRALLQAIEGALRGDDANPDLAAKL